MKDFDTLQKRYWERKQLGARRNPFHPAVKAYVDPKVEEIRKRLGIKPGWKLLDVGCGNGFFLSAFSRICQVTGIDRSPVMLQMNPVSNTQVMEAESLEYPDCFFDITFCHALLHHVGDPGKVLGEMIRVSSRYVVVLEPNRNNPLMFLFALFVREERAALKFSAHFLKKLALEHELKIIDIFAYGAIVPNKTPVFMLSLLRHFNRKWPLGVTLFLIAEKHGKPTEDIHEKPDALHRPGFTDLPA